MRVPYDVLISGCGPVGATLANLLRQQGYAVAIFDRDKDVFIAPRAMQIDAESCRIFQQLGIQSRLEGRDARPAYKHVFVDKNRKTLMALDTHSIREIYGHAAAGMRFHQPALEHLLRADFDNTEAGSKVDTYLGYEVLAVDGAGSAATLTAKNIETEEVTEFSGRYLVGADGGNSLCRKYITDTRIDMNYARRWIVMDVLVHDDALWNSLIDRSEFMCRPDAAVVFVKGCNNHVRFDFEVTDEVAETFTKDDAIALISDYFDTSSIEFQRIAPYYFYAGMPDKWRKGRVFIAGDAAHLTSPFSGQGLNMGIRDAANLAFKFDLVFRGLAGDECLNSYQDERWPHCERTINGATARGLMISANDLRGRLKRALSFFIGRVSPGLALAMTVKMSDFTVYENGLIGAHKLSGDRFIQPWVTAQDDVPMLLDDVAGDGFLLLTNGSDASQKEAWFDKKLGGKRLHIGTDIEDSKGYLTAYFDKHDISAILVRPDRYIFDAGDDAAALTAGLKDALAAYD